MVIRSRRISLCGLLLVLLLLNSCALFRHGERPSQSSASSTDVDSQPTAAKPGASEGEAQGQESRAELTNGRKPLTRLQSDRMAYRDAYQRLAVEQMKQHGVPASITLAQGMLESGNGKSSLAVRGNNHFGIKCHKSWNGKRMYHDDDARGECFRIYKSVEQSFEDHSLFLRGTSRYSFLFDLRPTDYRAWAYGLQQAGYATDPRYAERLIRIIEEEGLSQFDSGIHVEVASPTVGTEPTLAPAEKPLTVQTGGHKIYTRNRVKYVIVGPHDTYASLTEELEMMPWEIQSYNELGGRKLPAPNTDLYIQPKRRSAEVNHKVHVVEEGETIYSISQQYAVKTKWICRRNGLKPDDSLEVGQLIYLRGKMPRE